MRDDLYIKYRVFDEPSEMTTDGHPVQAVASYFVGFCDQDGEVWASMKETKDFVFVLKPDSDRHARIALAAYSESCREEFPNLSKDLRAIANDSYLDETAGDPGLQLVREIEDE